MKKRLSINLNPKIAKEITKVNSGSLIISVYEGPFTEELKVIDQASNGMLKKIRKLGELSGKLGEGTYLPALSGLKPGHELVERKCPISRMRASQAGG